jgi:hypothetical protein
MFLSWPAHVSELTCTCSWADLHVFLSWPAHVPELTCTCSWADLHMFLSWHARVPELTCTCSWADLHIFLSWPAHVTELTCICSWSDLHMFLSWPAYVPELTCTCPMSVPPLKCRKCSVSEFRCCSHTCTGSPQARSTCPNHRSGITRCMDRHDLLQSCVPLLSSFTEKNKIGTWTHYARQGLKSSFTFSLDFFEKFVQEFKI